LPSDQLAGLAYAFDYEHVDGHDPEAVVAPLRRRLDDWDRYWTPGRHRSLRYERGPGFLRLRDRRPTTAARDVVLDELEADLYLACLTGTTAEAAAAVIARDHEVTIDAAEVRGFFSEMVDARLLFREGDWYLALALPLTPDAEPPDVLGPRWKLSLTTASSV
jgi:hypothetical protein